MKYSYTFLFIVVRFLVAVGQPPVVFQTLPRDLQLFPRNAQNQATIVIEGRVMDDLASRVTLQVDRAGKLSQVQQMVLPASRRFRFETTIRAELAEYTVRVHLHRQPGDSSLIAERKRLLCGDMFLIYGQSNAIGLESLDKITVNDQFMRQCGYPYGAADIPMAMQWFPALQPYGAVGAFGLYMGEAIQKATQIPVGFINGSEGGANIRQLADRNPANPADVNTFYGRMLFRAQWAGVHKQFKAIIYKQGEAEAGSSTYNYPADFDRLYRMLREDYGTAPRLYASQINILADGSPDAGALRDFQRRLPEIYPEGVSNRATVGTVGYDGLHYYLAGNRQIGYEQAQQLLRDLYGSGASEQVNSPNVRQVFQNSHKDTLTMVFEPAMQMRWTSDSTITTNGQTYTRRLIDMFLADGQTGLFSSGWTQANRVYLTLKQPVAVQTLTYFPAFYNEGPSGFYDGPTLKNQLGMRAFTFDQYPVASALSATLNLAVTGTTWQTISLAWTVNAAGASVILLERSDDGGVSFAQIARLPIRETVYMDTPPRNQTGRFAYRIRVANQVAESGASPVVTGQLVDPCVLVASITGNAVIAYGGTLSLSAIVSGAATGVPVTYVWRGSSGLTSVDPIIKQQDMIPGLSGIYSLTATQGSCTATASLSVTVQEPLANKPATTELAVWPNPVRSGQLVRINVPDNGINEPVTIRLVDGRGQVVFQQVQVKQTGPLAISLPVLPAGLYLMEIRAASIGSQQTQRLLIE